MEADQYGTKWPMGHWGNHRRKKKYLDMMKTKHGDPKHTGHSQSSCKREAYSNTISPQKTRTLPNKQLNLHPKQLEKEEQTKPKV